MNGREKRREMIMAFTSPRRLNALARLMLLGIAGSLTMATSHAQQLPSALAGTAWRLVEFRSMDDDTGTMRPEAPALYTMRLAADGTVAMRLDCNRATGTWTAEAAADGQSGRFEFGPIASTRALCPSPSMDEVITAQAQFIRGFLLREGRLHLSLMADGGIFSWEPDPAFAVPRLPEDGGPRVFQVTGITSSLNMRERATTSSSVITTIPPGALLDNLGCQRGAGRVWCDVQQLGGGPRGYVAAEFLKPAVAPDGSVAMGPDDSALRAGQGDFDAAGSIPCAQARGQPSIECRFGVARAGGGFATVVVTRPDKRERIIYFRLGLAIGASTSQAEGYREFRATREGDLNLVRIGDERYEIPDAVVFGG